MSTVHFKSFADFKRRVSAMTLLRQTWLKNGIETDADNRLIGVRREVVKVNSVDIQLATEGASGGVSHLGLGKASHWTFDGDTVTKNDGYGSMTYKVEARDA
jgi:hypothetical protein